MNSLPNKIVLSLGGSLIAPKDNTKSVISAYAKWIVSLSKKSLVIVIVGGGYTARVRIQEAREKNSSISSEDLDWIGIKATHENANNLKLEIEKICKENKEQINIYPEIVADPNLKVTFEKGVVIGGGWKPGRSTDYDAVKIASFNDIKTVYNLSNVGVVFDKDPNKYPDAKPLPNMITWDQLIEIIGKEWSPGLSAPFDPIAAKLALESKITVKLVKGPEMLTNNNYSIKSDIEKALLNEPFEGTTIHS